MLGDLQRTSILELWRESNDAERRLLIGALVLARPDFIVTTGDLVFDGGSGSDWAFFDALAEPVRLAGIPVVSAFGNHEYWSGSAVEAPLFSRMPAMEGRHWYVVSHGPLRLVVLDSNVDRLPAVEWERQRRWYEETLAALDADAAVRGVLVLLHHPPYTNSTVTSDEMHVQKVFVPAFVAAKKTLVMQSGHVHSYERFVRGEKTFLVSGGGGGPRARLAMGEKRRYPDDRFQGPAVRDFNFVVYRLSPEGLTGEAMGMPKGGTSFTPMDRFFLPFQKSGH